MKLELKHLVGYLPFNLQSKQIFDQQKLIREVSLCNVMNFIDGSTESKIMLRPIEDLKETIEHDGKRFIPILELFKISISEDVEQYRINGAWDDNVGFACGVRVVDSGEEVMILSYSERHGFATQESAIVDVVKDRKTKLTLNQKEIWQKLYEWHFDVDGLLRFKLAVRKE